MKIFIPLALFLINSILSYSQEIKVINRFTNEKIENVLIYNQSLNKSILTNAKGSADISTFEKTDTILFQHPSFKTLKTTIKDLGNNSIVKLQHKIIIIPEFVVTASKEKENQRDIPHMTDVLSSKTLKLETAQNSADILEATGNIFIQKSQGGGGSPILRGFEANKVLLVVDGIRMNNAIYRGGHLQNALTIDNAILDKVEIVYGPNSLLYGSDALGGVIHYLTIDPELSESKGKLKAKASASSKYASAINSTKFHADFQFSNHYIGSLTSITNSNFGELRLGQNRNPFLNDWGKQLHYIKSISGHDTMVMNPNPNILKNVGYKQLDILQKILIKPSGNFKVKLNFQYSTSSDIPRYDKLSSYKEDTLKYARWDYGPQNRLMNSIYTEWKMENTLFSVMRTSLAYQHIEESRLKRLFGKDYETHQMEEVNIGNVYLDFLKYGFLGGRLSYGAEIVHNHVNSNADSVFLVSNTTAPSMTRYPDGHNVTWSYSLYSVYKFDISEKFGGTIGGRYNYSTLYSSYESSYSFLPFDTLKFINAAYTGAIGLVYKPDLSSKYSLQISNGYRIPNLDDVAKIRAKGNKITLPNPHVKPEYTYNAELGASKIFDGFFQISGNYYFSFINNAIVRVRYHLPKSNADSIYYEEEFLKTYINDNTNEAIIHGTSLNLKSDFHSKIGIKASLNFTKGKNLSDNRPLAHIPPIFGRVHTSYKFRKTLTEFYIHYSGWKKMDDMALTGEDNEDFATEYGFPSWYTLNIRSSIQLNKHVFLQIALENLTDNFYHKYSSGIPAPGFNFIASLKIDI